MTKKRDALRQDLPQGVSFFGIVFHILFHNLWKKDTVVEMRWKSPQNSHIFAFGYLLQATAFDAKFCLCNL